MPPAIPFYDPAGRARARPRPVPVNGAAACARPVPARDMYRAPGRPRPIPVNEAVVYFRLHRAPNAQQERCEEVWNCARPFVYVWFIWSVLQLMTGCEQPLMALNNRYGAMAPTLSSGDWLVMTNYRNDPIGLGDIVAAKVPEKDTLWISRVIGMKKDGKNGPMYQVRGDNVDNMFPTSCDGTNPIPPELATLWVSKKDIVGKMAVNIPLVGIPSLVMHLTPLPYVLSSPVFACVYLALFIGNRQLHEENV